MTCGAAGYISKAVKKPELAEAIQDVMAGLVTLPKGYEPPSDSGPTREADLATRVASLTRQQLRVLQMVRQGMLNKQIAHELGVGETTVKAHVSEIMRKLNVVSRTQAVIEVARLDYDAISPAPTSRNRTRTRHAEAAHPCRQNKSGEQMQHQRPKLGGLYRLAQHLAAYLHRLVGRIRGAVRRNDDGGDVPAVRSAD